MAYQVIQADASKVEGCPVLTRLKAFSVMQGVPATLQFVFRDRASGKIVDLAAVFASADESISDSADSPATASVVLRVKEALASGLNPQINPIWEITGNVVSTTAGLVEATLTPAVVAQAGIYELGWGLKDHSGNVVLAQVALMSVERSLFATDTVTLYGDLGPPTLAEIRLSIKDSAPSENLLLRDVEFATEEILDALRRPVAYFNEIPPPIQKYTTRTFPFREHWRRATAGYLFSMAADHYRRNHLAYQAGGLTVDDLNKERDYAAASAAIIAEYQAWALNKKVEINLRAFVGNVGSAYGFGLRR